MKVLSLFDGISCAQMALSNLNKKVEKYYASEIEKLPISSTMLNFSNTVQLGDITQIKGSDLGKIDLLIGGSPCTGFSVAGQKLNFNDPQSKLFYEYVRLLDEIKPTYFVLENVVMKQEWQDIINSYLGVKPKKINSSLVSAQSRKRLYWTNIPYDLPTNQLNLHVEDILEPENNIPNNWLFKNYNDPKIHWLGKNDNIYANKPIRLGYYSSNYAGQRIYSTKGKSVTITSTAGGSFQSSGGYLMKDNRVRKLTITEMKRLQTIPDNYQFSSNSYTQCRKAIGNCFTVKIIEHILEKI